MPEITRFYGIVIKLFFGDHPPPHFHAVYGEHIGLFDINTLEMIEWAGKNKNELKAMWDSQEFHKLPPLE